MESITLSIPSGGFKLFEFRGVRLLIPHRLSNQLLDAIKLDLVAQLDHEIATRTPSENEHTE